MLHGYPMILSQNMDLPRPYDVAPEICVEIVSPSNSDEMEEKIQLYLHQGAKEVWLCNQQGEISYFTLNGQN